MTVSTLLVLSIVIVAMLTATATAVRSVRRIWLRHWVERRLSGAPTAELYLTRPQRLILAATTGVALTVFVAGTFIATSVPGGWLGQAQAALGYAAVLLLFGQLIPRAIARRWPSVIIPPFLPVLRGMEFVLMPLLTLVRRLTGESSADARAMRRHEESSLGEVLREGELEGVGEHTEIAIIQGVVSFGEKTVAQVMTPRADLFAADATVPPVELARRVAHSGWSRVPIYRNSIDQIEGFVHVFDMLKVSEGEMPALRPIGTTPPTVRCNDLLFRMLRERRHVTIVRSPGGETLGLVTLEDLLEELVGEIRDEHDEPGPTERRTDSPR